MGSREESGAKVWTAKVNQRSVRWNERKHIQIQPVRGSRKRDRKKEAVRGGAAWCAAKSSLRSVGLALCQQGAVHEELNHFLPRKETGKNDRWGFATASLELLYSQRRESPVGQE